DFHVTGVQTCALPIYIHDVTTGICKKMIHRHPHIFGDIIVEDQAEVLENWEAIKKEEKGLTTYTQVLQDIPSNLPALMRAYKVQIGRASCRERVKRTA